MTFRTREISFIYSKTVRFGNMAPTVRFRGFLHHNYTGGAVAVVDREVLLLWCGRHLYVSVVVGVPVDDVGEFDVGDIGFEVITELVTEPLPDCIPRPEPE